ncbi:MAG TPA: Rid family detoxifying hydrolase [Candidatus Eisenbacteria bacterium]|nr:Rid family detoxifying hydrolase [Candidatus Eisenbacteria bacterium]
MSAAKVEAGRVVKTDSAPNAIGPYAQGRTGALAGRWIVTSGQVGIDPATQKLVSGGVAAETERAIQNLEAILKAGGGSLADIVKTTVFLADMAEFRAMNEVYARMMGEPYPSRSTIAVRELPLSARVEIEAWAFVA